MIMLSLSILVVNVNYRRTWYSTATFYTTEVVLQGIDVKNVETNNKKR